MKYVRKQCKNKGIRRAMSNHLVKELHSSNKSNITRLTDRGIPAEEFYKINGFEEIERIIFLHKNIKAILTEVG